MKSCLITGINGFLGSSLAETILKTRPDVRIVGIVKDRNFKSRRDILDRVSVIYGDIRDFETVRYAVSHYEIDTIFHLAATTILRQSVKDPMTCYSSNVMGTVNVLESARQCGVQKVCVASSDKAYGTYTNLPYLETYHVQASPDPYSTSKACTDLIAQSYAMDEMGLDVSIIRAGNIYGPGDLNLSRLMPRSILRALDNKPPQIYKGVGSFKREFMHWYDVCSAYLVVAERGLRGHSYNVGGSGYQTIIDTVNKIVEITGCTKPIEIIDKDFIEIKEQYLDPTKLETLGWKCKFKIDEGLANTVEWYKKYKNDRDTFYVNQ